MSTVQGQIFGAHPAAGPESESLDWAVIYAKKRGEVRIIAVGEQETVSWNDIDEAAERKLDRGEIIENIGMVELDIVDDDGFGEVVDEFAALIEEGGVVFVTFDNEPIAVGETGTLLQIVGDAANEVTRVAATVLEDPGEERGGGGFAVGAGGRLPRMKNSLSNSGREQ